MHPLVRPLEPDWKAVLDRVLRPLGYSIDDTARLAPRLAELSRAYNEGAAEGKKTKLPLEARIAFSFPRDVPKGAAAVRELLSAGGALAQSPSANDDAGAPGAGPGAKATDAVPTDRPLRILDLGAGLGAMTWGVLRALEAAGHTGRVEALLVDEDADALKVAAAIARDRQRELETRVGTVAQYADAKADIAILGQVLSEIDPQGEPAARIATQTALVQRLLTGCETVVIVEPALRDRTRHLHALRDRLVADGAFVHAPCLHSSSCPALATENDWCHEDLADVDLPDWVAPLAKAAGLRWQGLTFSYLVLRKDAPVRAAVPNGLRFRVTSGLLRSKGKTELFACAEDGIRTRVRRLEREGSELDELERGDIVSIHSPTEGEAPIDERGRIAKHVAIDVDTPRQ